ncbi:hypothetical protein BpHYR1_026740 [Brachionus plicatilis]|uniref:Uncharacterized protein n=1 Tax=Brachionus plicatilis TaxID=10195 RepID=A0A3M7R1E0_BRAPC|nr:hypothetical protein BpHYR1_026740 [Brachionus plicatilis]
MMNLPIKIIDIVTILFFSLLVVIIIFIFLQRNIRRFKLRNVRDPHFFTCKSIPKELRDAIQKKHKKSHEYNEPETLLTTPYQNLSDSKTKTFIIRMKAFEVSKNLENALFECGYRRQLATKFEDFIEYLINLNDDFVLDRNSLQEFNKLFVWAMLDPMKFDNEELRKMNKLINIIIERLTLKKPLIKDKILQHKLDLDDDGDCDLNKKFKIIQTQGTKVNNLAKSRSALSQKYHQPQCSFINIEKMKFDEPSSSSEGDAPKSSKLKSQIKNVFNSRKNSIDTNANTNNNNSKQLLVTPKEKVISSSKYEEIKDTSFDSQISMTNRINNNSDYRWSMTNESIKVYDSENEEIPLVKKASPMPKKRSGSQNQPNPTKSIVENIFHTSKSLGEENVGFCPTFETNF